MKAERKSSQLSRFFSLDCVKKSLVVFEINVAIKGSRLDILGLPGTGLVYLSWK